MAKTTTKNQSTKKAGATTRKLATKKVGATKKKLATKKNRTQYLFVQTASNGELVLHPRRKNVYILTLRGLEPTICFSDRPVRTSDNETTEKFWKSWAKGPDSFAENPPNAELVIFKPGKAPSTVTLELTDPQFAPEAPNRLSYTATLVGEGAQPITGDGAAALFIDNSGGTLPVGTTRFGDGRVPQTGFWTPYKNNLRNGPIGEQVLRKGKTFPDTSVRWELTHI